MRDALVGARCFVRGLALVGRPRIRRYAAAPIAISAALLVALVWVGAVLYGDLVAWLQASIPDWLHWLGWLLWILFAAAALGVVFFTFVLVVGIVAAPFHSMLADAVERHLTGSGAPTVPFGRALLKAPGNLLQELKKLLYALLLAVPFLLLFLVPGVNLAAPVLWFLFCGWITAFAFTDYAMSNHGLRLADMRRVLRSRLLLALGFGSAAFVACMVPFVNLIAVPAAVCGGAVLWVEQLRPAQRPELRPPPRPSQAR